MKFTLTILLIAISLSSCGQNRSDTTLRSDKKEENKPYLAHRDSIIKETEYGCVYVTKDTTAEMYAWLADESIDTSVFNELYSSENISQLLISNNIEMKQFKNSAVSGNWISLYVLDETFYVYSPSDWMFNKRILISDSALYHFGSDDWRMESIQTLKENPTGDVQMHLAGYGAEKIELSIRFIDQDQTIALWHRKSSDGYEYSELRVRSSEVRKFDMIVNDCLGTKCHQEFIFETPAYEEILKKYSKTNFKR
jgi:hypothetical protein